MNDSEVSIPFRWCLPLLCSQQNLLTFVSICCVSHPMCAQEFKDVILTSGTLVKLFNHTFNAYGLDYNRIVFPKVVDLLGSGTVT